MMATISRLEHAIARLRAMSHEEYTALVNRHSSSNNMDLSFNITGCTFNSYVMNIETSLIHSVDQIPTYNANYIRNDSEKFGASFEAPNFRNRITPAETYQNAA